jgi:transposase, IS5 family
MGRQRGFWDLEEHYAKLSKTGDPLETLAAAVEFEPFRYRLDKALNRADGSKGGRPPYDCVLMFKVLILQALYGLSDDQAEFMIRDRLSFLRFLGLTPADPSPDAKTIWLFREQLVRAAAVDKLFELFDRRLREGGYLAKAGQILDASLIPAPRQHFDDAEKAAIRAGASAAEIWPEEPEKAAQKDIDARWTLKVSKPVTAAGETPKPTLAIPVFGYKNHIGIDRAHGFIRTWQVTDAAAHDGARLREGLIDRDNTASAVWADTAYRSSANEQFLAEIGKVSHIHRKKPRGKPMPRHTARANAKRSRIRSAVEHVFAAQKSRMGLFIRTIGLARATAKIGLANLAYNMKRLVWFNTRIAPATP